MLKAGIVAAEKRWMKRVSSSRFAKWMHTRVRERVWRYEGPGELEV